MGLMDREYTRRKQPSAWGVVAVFALLLAGTCLTPDATADSPLEEGCCIVNVNTATKQELRSVPGIGPELAERIIKGRPYKRVDGLLRIEGIGKKSLKAMRPYLTVKGKTGPFE